MLNDIQRNAAAAETKHNNVWCLGTVHTFGWTFILSTLYVCGCFKATHSHKHTENKLNDIKWKKKKEKKYTNSEGNCSWRHN